MSVTIITEDGQPPLVELRALPTENTATSTRLTRRWRGTPEKILEQRQALLAAGGYTSLRVSETSERGLFWELTAEVSADIDPATGQPVAGSASAVTTVWTVEPVLISKSMWDFPPVVDELNKLGTDIEGLKAQRRFKTNVDALLAGENTVPNLAGSSPATVALTVEGVISGAVADGMNEAVITEFLYALFRGVTQFQPASWNLRRTRRVPPGNSWQEPDVRVGQMLTYGTLVGAEDFTAASIATALPTDGYWNKGVPSDRPAGDGAREVVTDFLWAENYLAFLYGPPV